MPNQPTASLSDLPARVRLFPLGGTILLPRAVMPLNIFEPRYLEMVRDAMASDQMIALVQPRNADGWHDQGDNSDRPALYDIGSVGRITQYNETGDGRYLIALTGFARFRMVTELPATTAYRQAEVDYTPYAADWGPADPLAATARADLESTLKAYLEAQGLSADWDAVKSADDESLVNTLSVVCPFTSAERQALLQALTLPDRASTLATLMAFAQGAPSDRTVQ
jgi:Lon protease-like protein